MRKAKIWLHAKCLGKLFFRCNCEVCRYEWTVFGAVAQALTDLRHHLRDYHGGVDMSD